MKKLPQLMRHCNFCNKIIFKKHYETLVCFQCKLKGKAVKDSTIKKAKNIYTIVKYNGSWNKGLINLYFDEKYVGRDVKIKMKLLKEKEGERKK